MKTISKILIGMALVGGLSACAGDYYVAEQPVDPVYTRPASPYAGAVWVSGEWVWRGGRYVYTNGYWTRPRGNRVWVSGNWDRGARGYYWRRGHWR